MRDVSKKKEPILNSRDSFLLRLLALCLLVGILPNCGGKKKSQDIGIAVIPEKPIVLTADTKDSFGSIVKAPWFTVRPIISNGSDSTVTILALKFKTMGLDSSGSGMIEKEWGRVPSDFPWVRVISKDFSFTCDFTHFGEIPSKASDETLYLGGDKRCPPCDKNGNYDPVNFPDPFKPPLAVDGFCMTRPRFMLGDGPGGLNNTFTSWSVQIQPIGWFGSYNDPQDRFLKFSTFRTQ